MPKPPSNGLWIKLTVGGVTRIGFGDAQGKTGGDAVKEMIGDAIRNAAMRDAFAQRDAALAEKADLQRRLATATKPKVASHE